jgi:hypothetical protein
MTANRLAALAAASVVAAWGGSALADVYTLNLSSGAPSFSVSDSGGVTTQRYDFAASGVDPLNPPVVQVGDEVIINFSFSGGPITLPGTSYIDVTSFYLTGPGFPLGDSATQGSTTLFLGGLGGSVVASGSEGDAINFGTTTSDGVASDQVFGSPVGPLTFDAISTDFVIQRIAGSTDPGTFGTLSQVSISADSRSHDAVPEPASWALMLVGFGGMGTVLRAIRKRAFA